MTKTTIKLLLYLSFCVFLFTIRSQAVAWSVLAGSVVLFLFYPDSRMRRGWIPISIIVVTTVVGNLFFIPGRVILSKGVFTVTEEALNLALLRVVKVAGLIVGAKLLSITTSFETMIATLKRLSSPLNRIGVPAEEFFETTGMTLRLLPGIKEDIISRYRSLRVDGRISLVKKLRIVGSVFIPALVESLRNPSEYLHGSGGASFKESRQPKQ